MKQTHKNPNKWGLYVSFAAGTFALSINQKIKK